MSAICPSLLEDPVQQGKNGSSVGVETERHCHVRLQSADARLGQTPAMAETILMSNITSFDKSTATGHRAEERTAGNDEE